MYFERFLLYLFGIIILVFTVGLYIFLVRPVVALPSILLYKEAILSFSKLHYAVAITLYIMLYILSVSCYLPVGLPFTMLGGFLFGPYFGTIAAVISSTIGSAVAFWLARSILRPCLIKKYRLRYIRFGNLLSKNGAYYLLVARLVPLIPVFLVNLLAGLSSVAPKVFIGTTVMGIVPLNFLYAYAGSQLSMVSSWHDLLSTPLLVVYLVFFCIVIFYLSCQSKYNLWQS
ncbi:MAG TPA: VTT domain-containing protein [Candidatus Babeliaceae bacterium]|nr:VTT domain-containing protein [Candidatus Babeliaceae bacterium]